MYFMRSYTLVHMGFDLFIKYPQVVFPDSACRYYFNEASAPNRQLFTIKILINFDFPLQPKHSLMNHYSPWSASNLTNVLGLSSEKPFQTGVTYAFLEDKENELTSIPEDAQTVFVSPSPSKQMEKRRNYLRTSDRKGMITPELDSVKKKLHFEGQSAQQEMLAAAAGNTKKNGTMAKMSAQNTKANILKIR